jgi:hypothetical protein
MLLRVGVDTHAMPRHETPRPARPCARTPVKSTGPTTISPGAAAVLLAMVRDAGRRMEAQRQASEQPDEAA